MSFSIDQIISLLFQYKYLVLFPVVVVEGPIVTIIAGFLASIGYMNFLTSYFVVVAGDLTGDMLYYAFGRFGKEKFISKYGRVFGITAERVARLENHFKKNGGKTLIFGKLAHGIGGVFLVAAGVAEMPALKFFWFNFLGTIVKSLALLLLGFYFGNAISKINSFLEFIASLSISLGIVALLAAAFIFYRKSEAEEKTQ